MKEILEFLPYSIITAATIFHFVLGGSIKDITAVQWNQNGLILLLIISVNVLTLVLVKKL